MCKYEKTARTSVEASLSNYVEHTAKEATDVWWSYKRETLGRTHGLV
jgi:hypothetical protein